MGSSLESFDIFEAMLCWFLITVKADLFPPIFSIQELFLILQELQLEPSSVLGSSFYRLTICISALYE